MSKLVFTILCVVGVLLWSKWKQDPELFKKFFNTFFGSRGPSSGGGGGDDAKEQQQRSPSALALDAKTSRQRSGSFSVRGPDQTVGGNNPPDPEDDHLARSSRTAKNGRNVDRGRSLNEDQRGSHERLGDGDRRRGGPINLDLDDRAPLMGRDFHLDPVGPTDARNPSDDLAGIPIGENKKKKKKRKERAGWAGEIDDDRGRSVGRSSGDEKPRERDYPSRVKKDKQRTRLEAEKARMQEEREESERLSPEELRERRLKRLEGDARLREEEEEFVRGRDRDGYGRSREDRRPMNGAERLNRDAARDPYDRMAPGRGASGQGYAETDGYGHGGGEYGRHAYQQGPGGQQPSVHQGQPGGMQYGSGGQYGGYSEGGAGYRGGQLAGEGYQRRGGVQLNDPRAGIQQPYQDDNNYGRGYGRQERNTDPYYDTKGRVIDPGRQIGRCDDRDGGDIDDRGNRQRQTRDEAEAAEERLQLLREQVMAKRQREAEMEEKTKLQEIREHQAQSTEGDIRVLAGKDTREHWSKQDDHSMTKEPHGSLQAEKSAAVAVSSGEKSADHAPPTKATQKDTAELTLADIPSASKGFKEADKDPEAKSHSVKPQHSDDRSTSDHAPAPPTATHDTGHIPATKVGKMKLNDPPPDSKGKFSAADAAKQHWGAKNQKSSTKGSEVDTSAPAPFAATSLPPPASELPPLPPIYETKRHNNEAKASKDPSETAGLQLNNVSGGHEPDKTEIPPSRHELPAKVHDQGNPVFVDSGPNSTPMPVPVQDTHLGRQKAPYYDDVYLGEVDAHPGLPPGYSKNLDKQHDKMTLQEANWNVANTHTTDNTNITLNNLAPGSSSGDQQAVGSKPPSGSGWDREPEREQYPEEKKKLRGNEITPSNIPEGDISGRTAGDGNHPTESSVPPIMVAQVQLPDDHSQLNLPYGSGDKKEIGMDIVDAKRLREEPSTTPPPRAAMNLQDVKPESRNSESPQKLNPNTTSESGFQSEIPDSLKQSLKTFCHNAKACKTRTMTFALICVGYIAATYFTSSLLIAQAPAAVAASTTASVAKRQAAINATEIAADTLSSVNDAFQDPGFLVGIVQGHVLLISTLWHLVAQLLIVCLINSIYSYEPPEGTPNEDTEKSGPSETSPLGKGSLWNPTSWWRRLTDRASRTQNWSQRHMGRWSFARYGLILALFLITLLIARQLTSLSYISRNPSSNEPWSTFPDVALIYDKLRASRTGLASGAGLVRVSMGFWFLVVFSGSYCMSTLADKPPARPSDLEQGKGVV